MRHGSYEEITTNLRLSDFTARAHIHGCLVHLKECLYPSHSPVFCTNISDQINWTAFLLFSCFQITCCYLFGKFLKRATNSQLVVYFNCVWSHVSETHIVWTCPGYHSARSDVGQCSDKFFSFFLELQRSLILSPVGQLPSLGPSHHSFLGYAKLNNIILSFQSYPRVPTLHLTLNSGFTVDYVALVQAVWHATWVCWDSFPHPFFFTLSEKDGFPHVQTPCRNSNRLALDIHFFSSLIVVK